MDVVTSSSMSKRRRAPECSVTITGVSSEHDGLQTLKAPRTVVDLGCAQTSPSYGVRSESDVALEAFEEQLTCGMCAAVFVNPVALEGCGHVYCGSCLKAWIAITEAAPVQSNVAKPSVACPTCRKTPLTRAYPSHLVGAMCEVLLKYRPNLIRPPTELTTANGSYAAGSTITFPGAFGVATGTVYTAPAPVIAYWRPCPSCNPADGAAWSCPLPVLANTFPEYGVCPDGHRVCAGCEALSPAGGPSARKCDICCEGFCGGPARHCKCEIASAAKPGYEFEYLPDLIKHGDSVMLEAAFSNNRAEAKNAGDYIAMYGRSTKDIYLDILRWSVSEDGMASGGIPALLSKYIGISGRGLVDPGLLVLLDETRICGGCAGDIIASGFPGWLARELRMPRTDASPKIAQMRARERCKDGNMCQRQQVAIHTKKFSHLYPPLPEEERTTIFQDDILPPEEAALVDSGVYDDDSEGRGESEEEDPYPDPDSDGDGEDSESEVDPDVVPLPLPVDAPLPDALVPPHATTAAPTPATELAPVPITQPAPEPGAQVEARDDRQRRLENFDGFTSSQSHLPAASAL